MINDFTDPSAIDPTFNKRLMKRFLADFEPSRKFGPWPYKYLHVNRFLKAWLFITFRKPPINPEWIKFMEPIEGASDTVTFRRPPEYLK